ncbi:MAG: hypothetical protein ACRECD_04520 [Burkholderiaceae bacterium]
MRSHNQQRDHQCQGHHHQLLQPGLLAFVAGVALLFFPEFNDELRPVASLLLLLGVIALTLHLILARLADRRACARRTDSAFGPNGPNH